MAKLYKTNGEVVEITPANGKKFTLKEAQKYVNGSYVELFGLKHEEQLICNEEVIYFMHMPFNKKATEVLAENYGEGYQSLYGDIIRCLKKEFYIFTKHPEND